MGGGGGGGFEGIVWDVEGSGFWGGGLGLWGGEVERGLNGGVGMGSESMTARRTCWYSDMICSVMGSVSGRM